jgi:hypothetical protein
MIYELYTKGEPSDNSELVSKITNEINNKLGNEENNVEVMPSEDNLIINEDI